MATPSFHITKNITYANTAAVLVGYVPPNTHIRDIKVLVDVAFNSAPDFLSIGTVLVPAKYTNDISLAAIGDITVVRKAGSLGILSTTDSVAIYALVVPGSSSPTAGSVTVSISLAQLP